MSQYDWGDMNPGTTSGTALSDKLDLHRDAVLTSHSGTSRPAYATGGIFWLDTSVSPWKYNMYDGAEDILVGTFDSGTNTFSSIVASGNISDSTSIGRAVLTATSTGNAQTAIGGTTVGKALFTAATDSAARSAISSAKSGINSDITNLLGCGPEVSSIAIGNEALLNRTTGVANVCIGPGAGKNITTGSNNSVYGLGAGLGSVAGGCTLIGSQAGIAITSSTISYSTMCGLVAGAYGSNNNYCSYFGYDAGSYANNITNSSAIGNASRITGSNQVQLGNSATTTYVYGTVQNRSDMRDKAQWRPTIFGLDFIKSLTPVDYKLDLRDDYRKNGQPLAEVIKDGTKIRERYHHGFLAQDVQKIISQTGKDFGGYQDHKIRGGEDVLSLGYDEFIAPMVKAIQELSSKVDSLQQQLNQIKG